MTLDFLLQQQKQQLDELFKKEKLKYCEQTKVAYNNGKLQIKNKKETLTLFFLSSHIMKIKYEIYDEYLNYLSLTLHTSPDQKRINVIISYDENVEMYNFHHFKYIKTWHDLLDFFAEKELKEDKSKPLLFTQNNIKYTIQLFNYFLQLRDTKNEIMA